MSSASVSDPYQQENGSQPSSSRPLARRRRRRAATACRGCRRRRTKCDNSRPSCGSCLYNAEVCEYTNDAAPQASAAVPAAAPSPADGIMLEQMNHAITLLKEIRNNQAIQTAWPQYNLSNLHIQTSNTEPTSRTTGIVDSGKQQSAFTVDGFARLEVSEKAAKASCCESVLRWPIVSEKAKCGDIISFPLLSAGSTIHNALSTTRTTSGEAPSKKRRPATLFEDEIYPLCKIFVFQVHIKNPVLDIQDFLNSAREVSEKGPGWDGQGCLALLACALASVSAPLQISSSNNIVSTPQNHSSAAALCTTQDQVEASEPYFVAAKRRLGSLDTSLLSVQCLFFAGVYEKFVMRPLAAWKLFQRACVEIQTYLSIMALKSSTGESHERTLHLEQRLYWACMSSECELRAELQLPASGLLLFQYPDIFSSLSLPVPASHGMTGTPQTEMTWETPGENHRRADSQTSPASATSLASEEEVSWLHYLAEVSLRKIMNQAVETVFGHGEVYWLCYIHEISLQLSDLREDLRSWRAHLPAALQFPDEGIPHNQFALLLKTRWLSCWEWVHRPFLYFIIQSAWTTTVQINEELGLVSFSQECLTTCVQLISLIAEHRRHGGVWVLLRRTFSSAVMLISASASPNVGLEASKTNESVDLALNTIEKWGNESPELRWMEDTLRKVGDSFEISTTERAGV